MFDTVLGWGFGAVTLAIAMLVALAAGNLLSIHSTRGRNVAMDGLRGYLAFGVFLHHSVVWYFYARTSEWRLPPGVYGGMGTVCVSLFFMITGYLFVGKLLDARKRPIDWVALFVSRVLRLAPLYLLAMAVLFCMVGALSGWQIKEPPHALLGQVGGWLSMMRRPAINGVHLTDLLIAGVTWSLAYEWLFYLSLPAIAILLRVKVPPVAAILCALAVVLIVLNKSEVYFPTPFLSGALAAVIARRPGVARTLRKPVFAVAVLVTIAAMPAFAVPLPLATLIWTLAFCVVACNNTLFGILSNRAAVVLGGISYGVYLLHGLLLSATFMFVIGMDRAKSLSSAMHWSVVLGVGVFVVLTAALTYRFIETPAIQQVRRVSDWIKSIRLSSAARLAPDFSKSQ